jgi:threonine/homoserine/homoserine lactone efflux protein
MSLGQGRRASVAAAVGCTLGVVPALLAAVVGLAAVLHTSALLFNAVKYAGVAYLLWLAWGAFRGAGSVAIRAEAEPAPVGRIIWRGILLNILNPKLSIFFLALLPPFLSGNPATATTEMLGLGLVFMAITLATFLVYGVFAVALRERVLGNARLMTALNRGFAAAFAALAGRLAFERA